MSHAQVIAAARDKVIQWAKLETAQEKDHDANGSWTNESLAQLARYRQERARQVERLIEVEAITCMDCGGAGGFKTITGVDGKPAMIECGCDDGARRTSDSAT